MLRVYIKNQNQLGARPIPLIDPIEDPIIGEGYPTYPMPTIQPIYTNNPTQPIIYPPQPIYPIYPVEPIEPLYPIDHLDPPPTNPGTPTPTTTPIIPGTTTPATQPGTPMPGTTPTVLPTTAETPTLPGAETENIDWLEWAKQNPLIVIAGVGVIVIAANLLK